MKKEDQDIAKYQAALKRSSFTFPRHLVVPLIAIAAVGGGVGLGVWRGHVEDEEKAAEKARDEKELNEKWDKERDERKRRLAPLEGTINMYAALDPATLPDAPIELSRGRRVLGVETLWKIEDPEARRILEISEAGEKRSGLFLPGDFEKNEGVASLAYKPEDIGTVVLVRSSEVPVGTYEGKGSGKDDKPGPKGFETDYSFVAIVVPERKVVARWTRSVLPPLTVQTTPDGIPLQLTFGELEAADYQAYADALFAGRMPGGAAPPGSGAAAAGSGAAAAGSGAAR